METYVQYAWHVMAWVMAWHLHDVSYIEQTDIIYAYKGPACAPTCTFCTDQVGLCHVS